MANYQVGGLEVVLKATLDESSNAIDKLLGKVDELNHKIEKTIDTAKQIGGSFEQAANQQMKEPLKQATKEAENLDKGLTKALNVGKVLAFGTAITKLGKWGVKESLEMVSAQNLLNATMGTGIDQADKFQKTITSSFNVASAETMRTQGYFMGLTSSLGIANEAATEMSENLTKLVYDLSSLYGTDPSEMYTKLQSGIIGQTKPLRSVGIDVTAQTIQSYLDDMGIKAMVQDLTQAEKTMLRYIAILDQSSIAHGNMADTINSPINQVKQLKAQVKDLGMWIGHVFMGTIGRAIPYVTAFVIVLKELTKAFAMLFGFGKQDNIFKDIDKSAGSVGGIGIEADKATGGISKLKKEMRGLLGFEEINLVQTPPEAGGGSGGIGGISNPFGGESYYDMLLDKIGSYDNKMEGIKTKATDIAQVILDWLGFTSRVNTKTGELFDLKWGGLMEMHPIAGALLAIATGFVGLKLVRGVGLLWDGIKKLFGIKKLTGLLGKKGLAGSAEGAASASGSLLGKIGGLMLAHPIATGLIVAAATGAVLLAKGYKEAAAEADVFEGVTDKTATSLIPFKEGIDDINSTIREIQWGKQIVSEDDITNVSSRLDELKGILVEDFEGELQNLEEKMYKEDYFSYLTMDEKSQMVARTKEGHSKLLAEFDEQHTKIIELMQTHADNGETISYNSAATMLGITEDMFATAIETLSANQKDQDTIKRNIANNGAKLARDEAAAVIQKAHEARVGVIKEAEERYAGEMRVLDEQLAAGIIERGEYDKLAAKSLEVRDKTIANANKTHEDIVASAERHYPELRRTVDTETGKILTIWDKMKKGWDKTKKFFSSNKIKPEVEDPSEKTDGILKRLKEKIANFYIPPITIGTRITQPDTSGLAGLGGNQPNVMLRAGGGFPETGEVYIAREAGSEMVGRIGGKNVVANNDQVAEAMANALINTGALGGNKQGSQQIVLHNYIGTRRIGTEIIDAIDEEYITTGRMPKVFG